MIEITKELMDSISFKAKQSERLRYNYNFHMSYSDTLQRFLNALEPGTYLHPHKHENPDKTEIFLILRGKVLVVEFDDNGLITDHTLLDFKKGSKGVEIPPKTWHSFIALEKDSIIYEIKEGPYIKETDKIFARWAPEEGTEISQTFNRKILIELGLIDI